MYPDSDAQCQKLDKKAEKLRFVGYCKESKGYRLFDEKTKKIFKRWDVTFSESDFGHNVEQEVIRSEDTLEIGTEEINEPEVENNIEEENHPEEEHHRPERQR